MRRDSPSSRDRFSSADGPSPKDDPFEQCSHHPGTEFLVEALQAWFGASPARQAMVANCGWRFFDVAAVAVAGYIVSCEQAFISWAARFGPSEADSACGKLAALGDAGLKGWELEMAVGPLFGRFLKEAGIRLPDQWTLLVFYAVDVARRLVDGKLDALEGAAILLGIDGAIADVQPIRRCEERPPELGMYAFQFLARGMTPETFEPLGSCPAIEQRIRREAADFLTRNAHLAIMSDNPADWSTNWR